MSRPSSPLLKGSRSHHPGSFRLPRRVRPRSVARVLVAVILTVIAVSTLKHRVFPATDPQALKNEEIVLGNCLSIEALRHADECFEKFDFEKGKQQPKRAKKQQSAHLDHEEDIPWISSYGLVLDYDAVYDRFSPFSNDERYTTKRTVKCLTGFHMSIVWDIQFATSLLQAYKSGHFGIKPDTMNGTSDPSLSCPSIDSESSASMSIKINCGFDIKRDAWGHPKDESDHAELETCVRMAWSWVKGRVGDQYVGPWAGLCQEDELGDLRCDRHRFQLEGAD